MSTSIDLVQLREHVFALDIRGHVCPYPELLTLKAIQSLSVGDTLEVTIDNPPSVQDIPITLEKRGLDPPEIKRLDGNTWQIIIRV